MPQSDVKQSARSRRKRVRRAGGAVTASSAVLAAANDRVSMVEIVGNIIVGGASGTTEATGYDSGISSHDTSHNTPIQRFRGVPGAAPSPVTDTDLGPTSSQLQHASPHSPYSNDGAMIGEDDGARNIGRQHGPLYETSHDVSRAMDNAAAEKQLLQELANSVRVQELITISGALAATSASSTPTASNANVEPGLGGTIQIPEQFNWTTEHNGGLSHIHFAEVFEVMLPVEAIPLAVAPAVGDHGTTLFQRVFTIHLPLVGTAQVLLQFITNRATRTIGCGIKVKVAGETTSGFATMGMRWPVWEFPRMNDAPVTPTAEDAPEFIYLRRDLVTLGFGAE